MHMVFILITLPKIGVVWENEPVGEFTLICIRFPIQTVDPHKPLPRTVPG